MKETKPEKPNGARPLQPVSMGNTSADEVLLFDHKIISPGSPFTRCGHIIMKNDALQISYNTLGTDYTAFIFEKDLKTLTASRFAPPARVHEIRQNPDGSVSTQKVGYGRRSVSRNALVISTTTSDGDLVIPWTKFRKVMDRREGSDHDYRTRNHHRPDRNDRSWKTHPGNQSSGWQRDPLEGRRIAFNGLLNSAVATVTASDSVKIMKPDEIALTILRVHTTYLQSLEIYLTGKEMRDQV